MEGTGAVAVFDTSGNFLRQVVSGSALASPWGLALAPASFSEFGGDLLVGNFSFLESEINAFDPVTGALRGTIPIMQGNNTPGGLWDITFGNGVSGRSDALYFTSGINGEANGLFGVITVPEPATLALLGAGLATIGFTRRRRSRA